MTSGKLKTEAVFLLHLLLTIGALFLPFLVSWQITVPVLLLVIAQHAIFGRCFMLSGHEVSEDDGSTFYSHVIERFGFQPNKKAIRFFVRKILYALLTTITLIWQLLLNHKPLLF